MKNIKVLLNGLLVLSVFTACSQKEIEKKEVMISTSQPLHSKIIAVESSK